MASRSSTATMNLRITARDEASKVFDQFATRLAESMRKVQEEMMKAFDMKPVIEGMDTAATQAASALNKVGEDAVKAGDGVKSLEDTMILFRKDAVEAFDNIAAASDQETLAVAKGADQTNASLRQVIQTFGETGQSALILRDKQQEAMDQIKNTVYLTTEQLVSRFKQVQDSFGNASLAGQRWENMTKQQMAAVISAAEGMSVQVTGDMSKLHKGFDFYQLQFAGMMVQQLGRQISGFFGKAITSAAGFDQNIKNVSGSLTAQGTSVQFVNAHMREMQNLALQLGSQGYFSANQIADAMNTLAKQGVSYQDIMGGALKTASDVAAANQEDLTATSNVISDIIHEMGGSLVQQYGTMQSAMQHVGDQMTVALHHARISMTDFLGSMKYAGPQASALGVHFSDLATTIAVLGQHGIRGYQAGTTLRRMLTNLTPTTKAAAAEMQKLGLIAANGVPVFYKANGQLKSMTEIQAILHNSMAGLSAQQQQLALKTIFGQYALSGMTAIVNTSIPAFQGMAAQMAKTGVAQSILDEKSRGAGFQIQKLKAHWDTFLKQLGELFLPLALKVVNVLGNIIGAIQRFIALHPGMAKMIAVMAGVGSALMMIGGTLLVAIGSFGMFRTAALDLMPVLGELSIPLLPLIGIMAAVAAGVTLLVLAWKNNFGGIRQVTQHALGVVNTEFRKVMSYIVPLVQQAIGAVVQWFDKMKPTFDKATHNLILALQRLQPLWNALWTIIKFFVVSTFQTIVFTIKAAWQVISGVFQFFADLLAGNWHKLWGDLWQILSGAVKVIIGLFELGFVGKGIKLFELLLSKFGIFGKGFVKAFGDMGKGISKLAGDLWSGLEKLFMAALKKIGEYIGNYLKVFIDVWKAFARLFHGDVGGFWKMILKAFEDGIHALTAPMGDWIKFIDGILKKLPGMAFKWASNMIDMFVHGIEAGISRVIAAAQKVANAVKSFLGFHSPTEQGPLADSDQYMPNMMKMYQSGIQENLPKLKVTLGQVAMSIQNAIAGNPAATQAAGSNTVNNVTNTTNNNGAYPVARASGNRSASVVINYNGAGKNERQQLEELAKIIRTQMSVVSAS